MSDPNQINSELARLLQILTSTAATAATPTTNLAPAPQLQLPPPPPLSIPFPQIPHQQSPQWPPQPKLQIQPLQPTPLTPITDPRLPPSNPHGSLLPHQQMVDPSSITTWPTALRYITTTIAPNAPVMAKLFRMKKNQRDNELVWYHSREELVKKHRARVEGNRRVDEILKQFTPTGGGGRGCGEDITITPEQEAEELHTFDLKVHKAATSMVAAMASELGQLGIPFFCGGRGGTPRLKTKEEEGGQMEVVDSGYGIEEGKLSELRRRMMELVGDLVGE